MYPLLGTWHLTVSTVSRWTWMHMPRYECKSMLSGCTQMQNGCTFEYHLCSVQHVCSVYHVYTVHSEPIASYIVCNLYQCKLCSLCSQGVQYFEFDRCAQSIYCALGQCCKPFVHCTNCIRCRCTHRVPCTQC